MARIDSTTITDSNEAKDSSNQIWTDISKNIQWIEPWKELKKVSFKKPVSIQWYLGGKLNVCANCVDRHLPQRADQAAILWEADDPNQAHRLITYRELSEQVNKLTNVYRSMGINKGDRVTIYMPMIPEAVFAMLACARMGAIHSVIFGGFSSDSITTRLEDCDSSFIITADEGVRGGKLVPLKANVDQAIAKLKNPSQIKKVLIFQRTGNKVSINSETDLWWHLEMENASPINEAAVMDAEDPLFILYTSGSTGKPKGVLHTSGGYIAYAAHTFKHVFGYQENEIYWCTADVGWITGHTYIVYGPLANGATVLMFEGVPNYPHVGRFWEVVQKHKVNIFYTAPTAIRALMREGDEPVKKFSRESLRLLGSVGEPINPEAWAWYHQVVGEKKCPIVDTWWQTETGGILVSPTRYTKNLKPGAAQKPLPGITPAIVDEKGQELAGECEGTLVFKDSWPGQMRTVYKNHSRFEETYFSAFPGMFFTGDGCKRDHDGDYWITGRMDDVLKISGHRIGTAEVESALVGHAGVTEAAVVGYPHSIKGQGVYAFVTLRADLQPNEAIRKELIQFVANSIGPIAKPDHIQWAAGLPKTRSGKIMRRILRKIAENNIEELGDTTTLADPGVVQNLIDNRLNKGL